MNFENPTLLLLHGFCENAELWKALIPNLNPDIKVVTVDLPGFGNNHSEATSIEEMADDVILQMDHLKLSNVCVIGHSLGGYVALKVAKKDSIRIKGLGLFHSNALSDSPEKKLQRTKSSEHIAQYGTDAFLKSMATSLLSEANTHQPEMMEEVHELIKTAPQNGILAALSAMADRQDELEFLANTKLPVLWIIGRHDTFMKVEDQLQQASLCRKTMIHILEDAGHLGMWESRDDSAKIVNQFTNWVFS